MRLKIRGMTARDIDIDLPKLTLVSSRNGTGKSTIGNALRLLALGYVPALGKRPSDTGALIRDAEMSVNLALEDGRAMERSLKRTESGYAASCETSWLGDAKNAEHHAAIMKLFGLEETDTAECLDIRTLLNASPNQRAARIEALLQARQRAHEETARLVARYTVQRLADIADERMPENYHEAIPMIAGAELEALRRVGEMLRAKILEGGVCTAMAWANEEKRQAVNDVARKTQARKELETRAAQLATTTPEEIDRLRQACDGLQRELGAARQRNAEADRHEQRLAEAERRLDDARKALAQTQRARQQFAGLSESKSADSANLPRIEQGLETLTLPQREVDPHIAKLREEAELAETAAREIGNGPTHPGAAQETAHYERLAARLDEAERSPWNEVKQIAEDLLRLIAKKGAMSARDARLHTGAGRLLQLAQEALHVDIQQLCTAVAEAMEAKKSAEMASARALAEVLRLGDRREKLMEAAWANRTEADRLEAQQARRHEAATAEYRRKRDALIAERDRLQGALHGLATLDTQTHEALRLAQGRLEAVEAQAKTIREEVLIERVEVAATEGRLATVTSQLADLERASVTRDELARIIAEIQNLEAEATVMKAIEWGLQRQREVEIGEAGGPLLAHMRRFLGPSTKDIPYFRAEKGVVEMGWRRDGHDIAIQALSGGEWAVFVAALTSAVIILRAAPVRILIVEAGECDDVTRMKLLRGIESVASDLTAAIVMTQYPPRVPSSDWIVLGLGEETHEAEPARSLP